MQPVVLLQNLWFSIFNNVVLNWGARSALLLCKQAVTIFIPMSTLRICLGWF